MILTALGKRSEGCSRLHSWLAEHPHQYPLWLILGDLRLQSDEPEFAVKAWHRARKASGALGGAALQRIGNQQLQAVDAAAARVSFREAIACNAAAADAHCGLATAASQLGDFTTQRLEAQAALEIDPLRYTAWYQLTLSFDDQLEITAERMQRAIVKAAGDPQAWLLYMAFGRVLEKLGRYDPAFAAFTEAHRRNGEAAAANYTREMLLLKSVREYLDTKFVHRRPSPNTLDYQPIFIVGMPRSGTTLVEAILSAHPQITGGGEMRFLYTWLQKNRTAKSQQTLPEWLAQADDGTLARLANE